MRLFSFLKNRVNRHLRTFHADGAKSAGLAYISLKTTKMNANMGQSPPMTRLELEASERLVKTQYDVRRQREQRSRTDS